MSPLCRIARHGGPRGMHEVSKHQKLSTSGRGFPQGYSTSNDMSYLGHPGWPSYEVFNLKVPVWTRDEIFPYPSLDIHLEWKLCASCYVTNLQVFLTERQGLANASNRVVSSNWRPLKYYVIRDIQVSYRYIQKFELVRYTHTTRILFRGWRLVTDLKLDVLSLSFKE